MLRLPLFRMFFKMLIVMNFRTDWKSMKPDRSTLPKAINITPLVSIDLILKHIILLNFILIAGIIPILFLYMS